jgi:Ni,Fe-hydrogenase III large subunit
VTGERQNLAALINGQSLELDAISSLSFSTFEQVLLDGVADGLRVAAMFAAPTGQGATPQLFAVLADDGHGRLFVGRTEVADGRFPSLTPRCPQVHLFEREIAEQWGLLPDNHPWLKPVRYHSPLTGRDVWNRPPGEPILPAVGDFFRVEGEEVHEVAVGPVHAGIIEPGHFRFQCHGERVYYLEIALGFQHRGVEQAMIHGPTKRSIHYAETVAGDSTIAHATTFCQVVEALTRCQTSARAQALRGIALELERLANHVGDLGALAGDVGFLPTASYCGRIRGDALNMTALLCGNRFGRAMVRPGGVGFDIDKTLQAELRSRLDVLDIDAGEAVDLMWGAPSVMARFEEVGWLPRDVAVKLGIVGPAARACGLARDVRQDHPSGIFCFAHIPVSTYNAGDIFSRALVRWLEVQQSIEFIRRQLDAMPAGAPLVPTGPIEPRRVAIALNEGWRGEVCHIAFTDDRGTFTRYKIVDPSFHNWSGLAYAMRNQEISDFPLCNKSFNLSYCGHDL